MLKLMLRGTPPLDCELDSGTHDNVISDNLYYKHFSCNILKSLNHNLCAYGIKIRNFWKNVSKSKYG